MNWNVEPVRFAIFRWVLREREEGRRDGVWEKGKDRSEQGRLGRGPGGDGTDTPGEGAGERRLGHKCWPRSLWPEWTGEVRDPQRIWAAVRVWGGREACHLLLRSSKTQSWITAFGNSGHR